MQAIKSLLAISVLAVAGTASATTVGTFNVTIDGPVTDYTGAAPAVVGTNTGVGTAVLDSSGLMTVTVSNLHLDVTVFGTHVVDDLALTSTFAGSYAGGVFNINDPGDLLGGTTSNGLGQETATACTGFICDAGLLISAQGTAHPYDYGSVGSVSLASGGTINTLELAAGSYSFERDFHFTPTPAVPVPAAAWLFGSSLLGLAGTARRRRSA